MKLKTFISVEADDLVDRAVAELFRSAIADKNPGVDYKLSSISFSEVFEGSIVYDVFIEVEESTVESWTKDNWFQAMSEEKKKEVVQEVQQHCTPYSNSENERTIKGFKK